MSVCPSSNPNTETEYHNPTPVGLQDMRGLLVRLETKMCNTPLNSLSDVSFYNVSDKIAESIDSELWEFCILTAVYDPVISNEIEIRIGILNILRMLCPISNNFKPEQVLTAWSVIEPRVNEIITQTRNLSSYKDTLNRLLTIKQLMQIYIERNTGRQGTSVKNKVLPVNDYPYKFGRDWIAWQENNYIIYTKDNFHFFRDLISNWDSISIEGLPYFKHKNSIECFRHVWRRQWKKGDILYDIYNHKNTPMRTQICTSDLTAPADQVRPCRCRGCTGCDGKPGHCRCIGRCRCVHDAADAADI